jgi:hypothetical protein
MTPDANFGHLMQYGAVGIIAAGLLALVVGMFRQFVNHALEQNKKLLERHDEMLVKNLEALHGVASALKDVEVMVREVSRDLGMLFNEVSGMTEGSMAHRIKPRRGGGGG